ncbi:MAG: hypothetical protein AAGC81_06900 [Pseudomonadota bacterium]
MLGFLGFLWRGERMKNATEQLLLKRAGLALGPLGKELLAAQSEEISKRAGNRFDTAVSVLLTMVSDPKTYGLDFDNRMKFANQAVRFSKDAVLPDSKKQAEATLNGLRKSSGAPGVF